MSKEKCEAKTVVLPVGTNILARMEKVNSKSKIQLLEGSAAAQEACYLIVDCIGPELSADIKEGDTLLVNPAMAMSFCKIDDEHVIVPLEAVMAVRRTIK